MRLGYRESSTIFCGMGKRIDDLQYERNINGQDIEDATGVKKKTLYAVKNGMGTRLDTIVKIAKYFNVSIDYLVYGERRNK